MTEPGGTAGELDDESENVPASEEEFPGSPERQQPSYSDEPYVWRDSVVQKMLAEKDAEIERLGELLTQTAVLLARQSPAAVADVRFYDPAGRHPWSYDEPGAR